MTRRRLLAECDSRELAEWLAYWQLEHLGGPEDRADLRMGTLAANAWNIAAAQADKPTDFDPSDFLPRFADPNAAGDGSAANVSPEQFSAMMRTRFPQAG